ncbi:hypothetical protein ACFQZT_33585 [Paenibacillus sp. GCM10027628]|uniref:hypothetical protein n=1 Tax=Paenibacillus sp. GCM10027628 TaxID=3273413 RepID=UPI00362A3756
MGRLWILVLAVCMMAMLLSGCSHDLTTSPPSGDSSPHLEESAESSGDVQNSKERQLVMLFSGLLRMDRQAGLSLTKKQAEAILPFVRKSKDEGSLNEPEPKQVMDVLSADQRKFLMDQSKQIKDRNKQRNIHPEDMTSEEREKKIEAFKERRSTDHPEAAASNVPADGGSPVSDGKALGKSIEQQLIELLESKR